MSEPTLDQLKDYINKINPIIAKVTRRCDCDYDYRCGNCQRIVDLQTVLRESPI